MEIQHSKGPFNLFMVLFNYGFIGDEALFSSFGVTPRKKGMISAWEINQRDRNSSFATFMSSKCPFFGYLKRPLLSFKV